MSIKKPVKTTTKKPAIDWAAMGYDQKDEEYTTADAVKVDEGPVKFKVQAGRAYRIGFPFVAPRADGGFDVRLKPVEHLKYYDEVEESGTKFVMPSTEELRKRVIDCFGKEGIKTHYLTPIIVYDTNEDGKLLSTKEVSYSIKVIAIPSGRYAKLKEASEQFDLASYDFMVTLDGDEKTEHFQKMNFKAITSKKDLNTKTAVWRKPVLVQLPDDEDEEATSIEMVELIAECYEVADGMVEVLGQRELKDSKIIEILEEWSDEESEDDEEGIDDENEIDDEEESEESETDDVEETEDEEDTDDVEDEEDEIEE